jgi:hypothetical protein
MLSRDSFRTLSALILAMLLTGCATRSGSNGEIQVSLNERISLPGTPVYLTPLSGDEIRSALVDHTATLPGGFIEYYAPDGKLAGWSDGQPYEGLWEIRKDYLCTALSGDPAVCSQVGRTGETLYWGIDGQKVFSPVHIIVPGNPRNLS